MTPFYRENGTQLAIIGLLRTQLAIIGLLRPSFFHYVIFLARSLNNMTPQISTVFGNQKISRLKRIKGRYFVRLEEESQA